MNPAYQDETLPLPGGTCEGPSAPMNPAYRDETLVDMKLRKYLNSAPMNPAYRDETRGRDYFEPVLAQHQ